MCPVLARLTTGAHALQEVATKAISALPRLCRMVGPPKWASAYLNAAMRARCHPEVQVRNQLWSCLRSVADSLEPCLFDMVLPAATEAVLDVGQVRLSLLQ